MKTVLKNKAEITLKPKKTGRQEWNSDETWAFIGGKECK